MKLEELLNAAWLVIDQAEKKDTWVIKNLKTKTESMEAYIFFESRE